jgi:hypothetical protein
MNKFCELTEYQLLDLQEDLKTIFMIKKHDYIKDLDDVEIEEIKFYYFFKKDIKWTRRYRFIIFLYNIYIYIYIIYYRMNKFIFDCK